MSAEQNAMQSPLVSVCLITFNHEAYIAQAIESVLQQETNFSFEIIVGEDESSDKTRDIVLKYRERFPGKVKVILGERKNVIYVNGRPTGRRNFVNVLASASGKYIAFLEGDDFWIDPLKLQKQVDVMEAHPEYSVCGHWVINVDEDGKLSDTQSCTGKLCPEVFSMEQPLSGSPLPLHANSWLFRRFNLVQHPRYSLFLKLPAADEIMMVMLLGQGNGYCLKESMSAYRLHGGGTWSTKSGCHKLFDMLQFSVAMLHLVSWRQMPRVLVYVHYVAGRLFLYNAREVVRTRSLESIKILAELIAHQQTVSRYAVVLLVLSAVVFLPVNVILLIKRKIDKLIVCNNKDIT